MLGKDNVAMAFGTPISSYLWPDSDALNASLKQLILEREKTDAGMQRSNSAGAWHSSPHMFQWKSDAIETLKQRAATMAREFTQAASAASSQLKVGFQMDCWANVLRRGHYNSVHDHPAAMWSGVYYVSSGQPDNNNDPLNGKLEFIDPRVGVNMLPIEQGLFSGRYLVDAIPGLMVMFPSWLKHMVHPFAGEGERISIAFNVYVKS